jgi:predicted RNase H-like HicB family nuclease
MKTAISPIVHPMQFTAVIWPADEGGFCVLNPDTGCASQGETVEEALANIEEATSLYLEDVPLENIRPVTGTFVTTFDIPEIV